MGRADATFAGQPAAITATTCNTTADTRTSSWPTGTPGQLTRLGELARARQALMADPLAPGTTNTLSQLTDPAARPQQPYEPVPPALLTWVPASPIQLPPALLTTNLRRARRGTTPGPSSLTADIAKVLGRTLQLLMPSRRCVTRSRPRQHPSISNTHPQPRQASSSPEALRRSPRTRSRRLPPTTGCPHHCPALCTNLWQSMPPVPVRPCYTGRIRSFGPQPPASNRSWPNTHNPVCGRHWGIWPCQQNHHAHSLAPYRRSQPGSAFRPDVLQHPPTSGRISQAKHTQSNKQK